MVNLKYAQDLIKTSNSSIASGFNMFVSGHPPITFSQGYSDAYDRIQGYEFAEGMAKNGEIAFINAFDCDCGGKPFLYGGFWVCNKCGNKNVDKDWWKIIVKKDGTKYCCHGLSFKNLQESDNYAFGSTFNESILNYGKLMQGKSAPDIKDVSKP